MTGNVAGAITLVLCLSTIAWISFKSLFQRSFKDINGNSIPDGPMGFPIIGSLPYLTRYPEHTLDRWAKKFGPLYSLWIGNQLFVVISAPDIAKDLLVKNGAIFSSRKDNFIKCQTILAGRGITATPYGEQWRTHRRVANSWLKKAAVEAYTPILDYETVTLVKDLYNYGMSGRIPINPQPHAGRCSLNNMLTIVFGTRTNTLENALVERALRLSREFMNCTSPISNLTDFIPALQHFPNYMTTRAKNLHSDIIETYGGMIKEIEARMKRGEPVPDCLAKTAILSRVEEQMDELDVTFLCAGFMIAGVESTASIMQWFSAHMPTLPDIQSKAHEELDRVVGRDRLPTWEDEQNLPYIRAIIKEVERCHNPFWLGTPHYNTKDFIYQGNIIPKDTVVVLNTYTMHHNPQRYQDPHSFNPERYLGDSNLTSASVNLPNAMERDHWMFGAGRRICPGMMTAEREVWLAISRMLWAFRIEEIPGETIDLKEYDGQSGRSPVPFRVKMIPRHENVAKVLGI